MAFVHLHNHSEYSMLDGATRVSDMVNRAVELGMPAVALTDHGYMYGIPELGLACDAVNNAALDFKQWKHDKTAFAEGDFGEAPEDDKARASGSATALHGRRRVRSRAPSPIRSSSPSSAARSISPQTRRFRATASPSSTI